MAITIKELGATINADSQTKKFAAHFSTNQSVKNIVAAIEKDDRFKGHGKVIADAISGKVGEIVMAKSGIVDHYIAALDSAFGDFTKQNTEWQASGKTKSLPVRVEFLLDKVMEHINRNPEDDKKIGEALALINNEQEVIDIRQSLIADGFEEASEPLQEIMVDIMLFSAGRLLINEAVNYKEPEIEKVEGEVVPNDTVEAAAHKKAQNSSTVTATDSYEIILSKIADENDSTKDTVERIFTLVDQLDGASDDVVESTGKTLQSSIPKEMFGSVINSCIDIRSDKELTAEQKESMECHKDIFQGLLPDAYKNSSVNINMLVDFTSTMMSDFTDEDFENRIEDIHKTYAIASQFIYTMIAGVVGTGTDTINLFRMCKSCINATSSDISSYGFDAMLQIFGKDRIMELPNFIERVNQIIRTNRTKEYATGEEYSRVMQMSRSKRVLQNGLEAIKKAA